MHGMGDISLRAIVEIREVFDGGGTSCDIGRLWEQRFPGIPKASWYRYRAEALGEDGLSALVARNIAAKDKVRVRANKKRAKDEIKEKIKRETQKKRKRPKNENVEQAVLSSLPEVIKPDDVITVGFIPAAIRINESIARGEKVVQHCLTPSGDIRNPRLFLQASRHVLEAMKVGAYVAVQLMEAQRIERFHQIVLRRIAERDAALVAEILSDLEQLNREWGVIN